MSHSTSKIVALKNRLEKIDNYCESLKFIDRQIETIPPVYQMSAYAHTLNYCKKQYGAACGHAIPFDQFIALILRQLNERIAIEREIDEEKSFARCR